MNTGDKVRIVRFGDWLQTLQQPYRVLAYDFKDVVLTVVIPGSLVRVNTTDGKTAFVQAEFLEKVEKDEEDSDLRESL